MNGTDIERLRSFNREVTRRIGVLNPSFLERGRPLAEARLIYEIGRGHVELRTLRARLGLDSGHLSRLVRSLSDQGLIETKTAPDDKRVRCARLTPEGRRERESYDRLSDEAAADLLAPLSEKQRARFLDAAREIERLLRARAVSIAVESAVSKDARACLSSYFSELSTRFETGFDPGESLPLDAPMMTPPAGCFVVARLDGDAIGCGALTIRETDAGYIKRMWVAPNARGLGVGRRVLLALEEWARAAGLARIQLETNRALTEAQNLYRASGYSETAPFNAEPYAHHWFEKRL